MIELKTKEDVKRYLKRYEEARNLYMLYDSRISEGDLKGVSFEDNGGGNGSSGGNKWNYFIMKKDRFKKTMDEVESFVYESFNSYDDLDIIRRRYLISFDVSVVAVDLSITTSAVRKRIDKAIDNFLTNSH